MTNKNMWMSFLILVGTGVILSACSLQPTLTPIVAYQTSTGTSTFQPSMTITQTLAVATLTPAVVPTSTISSTIPPQVENSPSMPTEFLYFFEIDMWHYYVFSTPNGMTNPAKVLPLDQGQASWVDFSNSSDRLWFIKPDDQNQDEKVHENQLWISNLRGQESTLVYTTTSDIWQWETMDPLWTPDDLHIIIQTSNHSEDAVIYDVKTRQLEDWPYDCNRLALSPHSSKLALWCDKLPARDKFAVIEWGGEIWFSPSSPQDGFTQTGNLAWSADGKLLAFSDDTQPDGNVYLMDQTGKLINMIPGIMAWRHPIYKDIGDASLSWSANGQRLLFLAPGPEEKPCMPDEYNPLLLGPASNPPCWHVYDMASKQIIWDLPDAIVPGENYESHIFENAALSSDGRYLALGVNGADNLQRGIWVIDLETDQKILDYPGLVTSCLRWGPVFDANFSP